MGKKSSRPANGRVAKAGKLTEAQIEALKHLDAEGARQALYALGRNPKAVFFWEIQDDWVTYNGETVSDAWWQANRFEMLEYRVGDGADFLEVDLDEYLGDNGVVERCNWKPGWKRTWERTSRFSRG